MKVLFAAALFALVFFTSGIADKKKWCTSAIAADNMAQVQLIIKKLRDSLSSMKDFDELEDAGLDKADVDRMRRAMQKKINQMTSDAVTLIRAL